MWEGLGMRLATSDMQQLAALTVPTVGSAVARYTDATADRVTGGVSGVTPAARLAALAVVVAGAGCVQKKTQPFVTYFPRVMDCSTSISCVCVVSIASDLRFSHCSPVQPASQSHAPAECTKHMYQGSHLASYPGLPTQLFSTTPGLSHTFSTVNCGKKRKAWV